jgi:hypothetical protein
MCRGPGIGCGCQCRGAVLECCSCHFCTRYRGGLGRGLGDALINDRVMARAGTGTGTGTGYVGTGARVGTGTGYVGTGAGYVGT